MSGTGFTVDLNSISTLSTGFETAASDLETAFADWQTGADQLRQGFAGIASDFETSVLGTCKARQVLTVTGLLAWSTEVIAWWESMVAADDDTSTSIAGIIPVGSSTTTPTATLPASANNDELRR